jgi:aerotaxis receptor
MKRHAEQNDDKAGAIPFPFEELFFSRTNGKGHILSGNSVFQRISMYSWEELLGKPHSIIRHADMPRAVFWLLWDIIKKGQPIGAYVKNRAKDGRYYWVFAIVTPIEGGYLSVRLKPSSPLFKVVEQEYKPLAAMEQSRKMKPAESAQVLLQRVRELGFRDYNAFMATALCAEMKARNEALGLPPDLAIGRFGKLSDAASELLRQAGVVFGVYAQNACVPMNMRIQAAQLGEAGATIGAISENYNVLAAELKTRMEEFIASSGQVFEAVNQGLFLVCTAQIQKEILDLFHLEAEEGGASHEQEAALLDQQRTNYESRAADGLGAIATQAERFNQSCLEMKKLTAGLEVARVMGKIESARLLGATDGLNGLIDSLATFQSSITYSLKAIDQLNRNMQLNLRALMRAAS